LIVSQTVVRVGMPPTESIPAIFQLADASRIPGSRLIVGSPPFIGNETVVATPL
jgi:hypothetical protein